MRTTRQAALSSRSRFRRRQRGSAAGRVEYERLTQDSLGAEPPGQLVWYWQRWWGSPEMVARVAHVTAQACSVDSDRRATVRIAIYVADDVERFGSDDEFLEKVTTDAVRHWHAIEIHAEGGEGPIAQVSLTRRRRQVPDRSYPSILPYSGPSRALNAAVVTVNVSRAEAATIDPWKLAAGAAAAMDRCRPLGARRPRRYEVAAGLSSQDWDDMLDQSPDLFELGGRLFAIAGNLALSTILFHYGYKLAAVFALLWGVGAWLLAERVIPEIEMTKSSGRAALWKLTITLGGFAVSTGIGIALPALLGAG